jgi:hypothetical protein
MLTKSTRASPRQSPALVVFLLQQSIFIRRPLWTHSASAKNNFLSVSLWLRREWVETLTINFLTARIKKYGWVTLKSCAMAAPATPLISFTLTGCKPKVEKSCMVSLYLQMCSVLKRCDCCRYIPCFGSLLQLLHKLKCVLSCRPLKK